MQWLIVAHDYKDPGGLERRIQVREQHLENVKRYHANGNLLVGGVILGPDDRMAGTAAVAQFDSREELEKWLTTDPYAVHGVWQNIEVYPYQIAPRYSIPGLKRS